MNHFPERTVGLDVRQSCQLHRIRFDHSRPHHQLHMYVGVNQISEEARSLVNTSLADGFQGGSPSPSTKLRLVNVISSKDTV